MELSPLMIVGTRSVRAEMSSSGGASEGARSAWLSRLPSVEPGSMSSAYRSFRAQEAMTGLSVPNAVPGTTAPNAAGQPAVLSGSVPGALAAYGEVMED